MTWRPLGGYHARVKTWVMGLVAMLGVLSAQGPPDLPAPWELVVVSEDANPTQRAFVGELRAGLGAGKLTRLEVAEDLTGAIRGLAPNPRRVWLSLGARASAALLAAPARGSTFVADLDEVSPELRPSAGESVFPVNLRVRPTQVQRRLRDLIPSLGALAVLSNTPWELPGISTLSFDFEVAANPRQFVASLKPQVRGLLLLDEEPLLAVGEELVRAAREAGLIVVTTAPWLARSGATVGVLPDLRALARRFLAAVAALPPQVAHLGGDVPTHTIVNLDVWQEVPLDKDPLRLVWADEIVTSGTGGSGR